MLTFYHDLGHIVYFGGDGDCTKQELKDVVILDPQWLIDAFKKVITVVPPREQVCHCLWLINKITQEDCSLNWLTLYHENSIDFNHLRGKFSQLYCCPTGIVFITLRKVVENNHNTPLEMKINASIINRYLLYLKSFVKSFQIAVFRV